MGLGTVGSQRTRFEVLAGVLICLAMAMAGCGGSSETPEVIYISPPPATLAPGATPTPTPPPPGIGSAVISTTAPDGRWTVTFKKPAISGVIPAAATNINTAITARVNSYISAFTSKGLPAIAGGAGPSTLDGDFTIALDTRSVISLRFSILTYVSGAASSVGQAGSINLNASTGATINLADLFSNSATALSIISSKTKAALSSHLGNELTWPSGTLALSYFDKAWVFTPAGLEFAWSQEAIATHAAGMPSAVVSWADLKPAIKADGPAGEFVR